MEDNRIDSILDTLHNIKGKHQFSGMPIREEISFLTINNDGYLALIVKTTEKANYSFSTKYLSLTLSNYCRVVTDNHEYVGSCHILRCNTTNPDLIKLFIMLSFAMGKHINSNKNSDEMISFFNGLVELFKVTPNTNMSKERQGLWGELFVMKETGNIPIFAEFWHSEVNRKFDFSCEEYRIEVKTTTRSERIHSFSHNQVYRNDEIEIVIASLLLQEEDAGLSLKELIHEVRSELQDSPHNLLKLEKAIRKAGMTNTQEDGPVYDYSYAKSKLAWFNSICIPKFNLAEPKGVSNTSYNIDLSTAESLTPKEKSLWLGKWRNRKKHQ